MAIITRLSGTGMACIFVYKTYSYSIDEGLIHQFFIRDKDKYDNIPILMV